MLILNNQRQMESLKKKSEAASIFIIWAIAALKIYPKLITITDFRIENAKNIEILICDAYTIVIVNQIAIIFKNILKSKAVPFSFSLYFEIQMARMSRMNSLNTFQLLPRLHMEVEILKLI